MKNKYILILSKVLQKEPLTAEETDWLNAWLQESPCNNMLYQYLTTSFSLEYGRTLPENKEALFLLIQHKIELEERKYQLQQQQTVVSRHFIAWKKAFPYAAALIMGVLITVGGFLITDSDQVRYVEVRVPAGSSSEVMLPDSSFVRMNSGTTIRYADNFGKKNVARVVELSGEAFFQVKKQAGTLFEVCGKGMRVVVKGTEFNVKAYPEDITVEAYLEKGCVDFCTVEGRTIQMKPQDKLEYNLGSGQIHLTEHVDKGAAWRDGYYQFDDEELGYIVQQINRIYNVNITFDDPSLEQIKFSGTIDKNKPLDDLLNIISISTNVSFKQHNDTIIIYIIK